MYSQALEEPFTGISPVLGWLSLTQRAIALMSALYCLFRMVTFERPDLSFGNGYGRDGRENALSLYNLELEGGAHASLEGWRDTDA